MIKSDSGPSFSAVSSEDSAIFGDAALLVGGTGDGIVSAGGLTGGLSWALSASNSSTNGATVALSAPVSLRARISSPLALILVSNSVRVVVELNNLTP